MAEPDPNFSTRFAQGAPLKNLGSAIFHYPYRASSITSLFPASLKSGILNFLPANRGNLNMSRLELFSNKKGIDNATST